jgi:subtilisin family serine protease
MVGFMCRSSPLNKISLFVLAIALGLSSMLSAQEITSTRDFRRLATDDNLVPVIVELKAPDSRRLVGRGDWLGLGDYIDEVQREFIDEAGWRNLNDILLYDNVPAVARHVDRGDLDKLLKSRRVKGVFYSSEVRTSLRESLDLVEAADHRSYGSGGAGQIVAVMDTGIDSRHPFLRNKVVAEACFTEGGACPNGKNEMVGRGAGEPCAFECDHGTHVAGIIAGDGDGLRGVAPEADLISVQVFYPDGEGGVTSSLAVVLAGLDWILTQARERRIAAVNMSLGGGYHEATCDEVIPPLAELVESLARESVATVIASGNEGFSDGVAAPACISSAISVGSVTKRMAISSFSNSYAPLTMLAPGGSYENKSAPILSSVPGGSYRGMAGTSMAAPHVAGAWALLQASFPAATYDQVRQALLSGGRSYTDPRNGVTTPILNVEGAGRALELALRGPGSNTPAPEPPARRPPSPSEPPAQPPRGPRPDPTPRPDGPPCRENVGGIIVYSDDPNCVGG